MNQPSNPRIMNKGKGLVVVLSIFLAIILIPALLTIIIQRTFLFEDFYVKILEKEKIYEKIPDYIVSRLMDPTVGEEELVMENLSLTSFSEKDIRNFIMPNRYEGDQMGQLFDSYFWTLKKEQVQEIIQIIVPEDYFKEQTYSIFKSFMDYINLKTTNMEVFIDLKPIQKNIQSDRFTSFIDGIVGTYPECTQNQVDALKAILKGKSSGELTQNLICDPPAKYDDEINIPGSIQWAANFMPEKMPIISSKNSTFFNELTETKYYRAYVIIHRVMDYLPLACLVLAALIILLSTHSIKRMLILLGIPLFISGLLTALLVYSVGQISQVFLSKGSIMNTGTFIDAFVQKSTKLAISQTVNYGLVACAIAFGAGLIFIIITGLIKNKSN
jgi:hypothetical protein